MVNHAEFDKPSRYLDALVSGTPRGSYSAADAERALATLTRLRRAVVDAWQRLLHAETDHDEGGRP